MFTVIQYTNDKKEQDISVHGYFTNYDKALNYCKNKAKKTLEYYIKNEDNNIIKLNGYDCFIDTYNYILLRNNTKFGNIRHKFNCVVLNTIIDDELFEEIIQDGLDILECDSHTFTKENTSIYVLCDQISGGEKLYKFIKEKYGDKGVNGVIEITTKKQ